MPYQPLLSVDDLAEYLGVPKTTVYRWQTRGGGPPALRVGKYLRFRLADVEDWLDRRAAVS